MADPKYQQEAEQSVKESIKKNFSYRGDKDLGHTWAMTFSKSRDSGLQEQSNYAAITKDLEKRFPKDVEDAHFSDWLVGWVDQLLVRMLDKNGKVTKAGIAALEWKDKIKDYPIADDEDYTRREFEATLDNIKFEGSLDEQTAQAVYDWLSENDQRALENVDEKGGYPSKKQIDNALRALGVLKDEESSERKPYVDPQEQQRLWP